MWGESDMGDDTCLLRSSSKLVSLVILFVVYPSGSSLGVNCSSTSVPCDLVSSPGEHA